MRAALVSLAMSLVRIVLVALVFAFVYVCVIHGREGLDAVSLTHALEVQK